MKVTILTLFPEFFTSPLQQSILKRAQVKNQDTTAPIEVQVVNIRDFATDKHHVTDDRPYGGGAGMVMKVEPIDLALESLGIKHKTSDLNSSLPPEKESDTNSASSSSLPLGKESDTNSVSNSSLPLGEKSGDTPDSEGKKRKVILTSAKGIPFTQQKAQDYSKLDELIIICGHYEGVDERVADNLVDEEVRIGEYVLTGGEPAAVVMLDAVTRLLPGVLGNEESAVHESHSTEGYIEHAQYTRPEEYKGWKVPEILLSGHHAKIDEWRGK